MATQEEINRVIEATDIVALVSEYVKLEKAGKNYRGLCPFHNEKTPSFSVSPEKKIAKCMGCGKGGNPITFLKEIKNISFNEALAELAEKASIKIDVRVSPKKNNDFLKYYQITQLAQNFYSRNLLATKSGELAVDYLHKRGIDDETIKLFDIGLSPNKPDVLYQYLREAKCLELDMMDLGLVNKSTNGYYDLFTKRIMFPIKDELGNIVGFSGRIYQTEDKNQPKYVNSPETIIFKKGHVLYNLNNAISDIRKKDRVILHEGFMDVMASVRVGNGEAVCSMGTALTADQARMLKKYCNKVIICYDGDKAGIKASIKAIDILGKAGLQVHLVLLPDGMDPDEYIRKFGQESYLDYFESHQIDPLEYQYINALKDKNLRDFSQMEEVKLLVFDAISKTNSQTVIEVYLKRLSEDMSVSYASLVIDYNSYHNKNHMLKNVEVGYDNQKNYDINNSQSFNEALRKLTAVKFSELRLMNYGKLGRSKALEIDGKLKIFGLEKLHRELWLKLIDTYYDFYEEFNEAQYLHLLSDEQKRCYLNDVETLKKMTFSDKYSDNDLADCIKSINNNEVINQILDIDKRLALASLDGQIKLIAEKIELLKKLDSKKNKDRK